MSLPKCSLLALAILMGAMLSRPINGCMLLDDPTTPRSGPGHAHVTQPGSTGTLACDDPDEQFLKESKVATDAPGLVKYLQQRSGHDEDLLHLEELIRQLGNPDFKTRRQAAEKLLAVGPPAHARLLEAQKDKDKERARGAKEAAEEINRAWNFGLNLTVVRRLVKLASETSGGRGSSRAAQTGSAGASPSREGRGQGEGDIAKALLQFLPYAADEECEEEIWFGLDTLAGGQGAGSRVRKNAGNHEETRILENAATSLADSLKDKLPIRRAAAGYLFTRRGNADQRAAGKKLLADPDPLVRLRTAQGLLGAKDKDAIPVLIELLEKLRWTEEAWQAEEMLSYVAGDDSPYTFIGSGSSAQRQACRQAWKKWWEETVPRISLTGLDDEPRRPLLLMFFVRPSLPEDRTAYLALSGCNSRTERVLDNPAGATDFCLAPEDRVLLLGPAPAPLKFFVASPPGTGALLLSEQQLDGRILWHNEGNRPIFPKVCKRLPNGNAFAAATGKAMEITPAGETMYSREFKVADGDFRQFPYDSLHLAPNGRIVCPWEERMELLGWVEFDSLTGALVKKIRFQGNTKIPFHSRATPIQSLADGHCLMGVFVSSFVQQRTPFGTIDTIWQYRVLEADGSGNIVWQQKLPWGNVQATKLRNGNYELGFLEMDPSGKIVAEIMPENFSSPKVCLPLVGLGFDDPRPPELDLATSVSYWAKGLQNKKRYFRARSASKLAEIAKKDRSAVPPVIEAFDDPDEEVRKRALEGLAEAGAPALDGLLKAAKDPRLNVRWRAVADLRQFENNGARVVPVLVESLKDESVLVREAAAQALGKVGRQSAEAVQALIAALDDKGERVAGFAAFSLGELGPAAKPAIPRLFERVTAKRDFTFAEGAAELALARIGKSEKEVVSKSVALLGEKEPMVRLAAAGILGGIGRDAASALPELIKSFEAPDIKDQGMKLRCQTSVVWALGQFRAQGSEAVPFLMGIFKDKGIDERVRIAAVDALGDIGLPAVSRIPELRGATDHANENLKEHIRNTLDKLRQAQEDNAKRRK